jgi:hypothetical protein
VANTTSVLRNFFSDGCGLPSTDRKNDQPTLQCRGRASATAQWWQQKRGSGGGSGNDDDYKDEGNGGGSGSLAEAHW